jgi:hypothetical protein
LENEVEDRMGKGMGTLKSDRGGSKVEADNRIPCDTLKIGIDAGVTGIQCNEDAKDT